jgi:PAS domain S-box-containing protein
MNSSGLAITHGRCSCCEATGIWYFPSMSDYSGLTRAELIERLGVAESRSGTGEAGGDQQLALRALRDSEARLRAILQTAVEGVVTIDERGIIESANPAAERIFGYTAEEMVGRNVGALMPEPHRESHDAYLSQYMKTGEARVIGIGREIVGRRKDGTLFPMDLSVSEVHLAERRLFTGFVRDITERKRTEQRLQVQYAITRALAESSSWDEAVPKVMRAFCETLGWSFGEFWSVNHEGEFIHHVESWYPPSAGSSELEVLARRMICRRGVGLPGRVWESGKFAWIGDLAADPNFLRTPAALREGLRGAFAFPVLLDGEVLGVMIFFTRENVQPDSASFPLFGALGSQIGQFIERKRAERRLAELARTLADKNKELETIFYVASHDLRSPLVNIQGFSQELARACEAIRAGLTQSDSAEGRAEIERLLAEDIAEAIAYIMAGVKRIDGLLAGFLRFSRLGRSALCLERLYMSALVQGIVQSMDFQIKTSGAKIEIQKLPDCVGDAIQINQVFSNLLDNAVKYLDPERPGKITVSGRIENGRAIYAIEDNGIGIAPEHQNKIFEIFHRLEPGHGEGEGLGLTIAQRVLERQNGRIWVQSQPRTGSCFFVSLPAGT